MEEIKLLNAKINPLSSNSYTFVINYLQATSEGGFLNPMIQNLFYLWDNREL